MIPSALAAMLQQGVGDYLRMSFWSSTPGMESVIDRLVASDGAVFKGPYVSVKMPFRRVASGDFFPEIPLEEPAYVHQERAWKRLGGTAPRSTLVATGTGSGKTECFLLPILEHCRRAAGSPGVKAILIYPMNALATDQARRIAELCSKTPALAGIRAGLYIGEREEDDVVRHGAMGADHIITDRKRMQRDPPDLLLTNYKMLDYLLVRPADQEMWAPNATTPVRFLVVDELHTFDGAQGTDLACLVRRLKARLAAGRGSLCCVGTSATLGSESAGATLREYAEQIFGEPFDDESVIGESRQTPEEFFAGRLIELFQVPSDAAALDPSSYDGPDGYVVAQQKLWFEEPLAEQAMSDAWRVALGEQLLRHAVTRNLMQVVGSRPTAIGEVIESLARTSREMKADPVLAERAVVSILALVSQARTWRHERPEAQAAREAEGRARRTAPLLEVRLQLWLRALQRMVADVAAEPSLRFADDLTEDQLGQHLPVIHCRDCGAMGWASLVTRDRSDVFAVALETFYRRFFADDPQIRFLWPGAAVSGTNATFKRFHLDRRTLEQARGDLGDDAIEVVQSDNAHTVSGKHELHRDCPFCGARESLALLGFRAATLTAVFIDQLFSSRFNEDKKLLAFSDSVQDAAHRAGFFGARTWSFNLRVAVQQVVAEAEGRTLAELPELFSRHWRAKLDDVAFVSTFLAPNMEWLSEYEEMQTDGRVAEAFVGLVEQRIAYEIPNEYGLQARIGRSLPRTGCSTVVVDRERLDAATDALLERLRNEVGGLRALERAAVRTLVLGALHHLREVGGIHHAELPERFVASAGENDYVFKQTPHLPSFGPRSRFAALLTSDPRSRRFDRIFEGGWYARWVERVLGASGGLMGTPAEVWAVVLPVLVGKGLLEESVAQHGKVWGLAPEALRVTNACARLRCPRCRHWIVIAASELPDFRGAACLAPPCVGLYEEDGAAARNYFGNLIVRGEVERVFPEEHTGLLERPQRETIEEQFKAEKDRKPWYPNLLSCTPTLEMGIDIGSLSAAILCSVPPGQANYLQRIGRTGRRDGNSVVLAIARAHPHDLYFYAKPTEMVAGEVQPPGVFLNASGVLERQLTAFSLDQWNASAGQHRFAHRLKEVFGHLEAASDEHFPFNWLAFVRREQARLLEDFVRLFNAEGGAEVLKESTRRHLEEFLVGNDTTEGSLSWKVLDALQRERKSADSLRRQARRLKDMIKELESAVARDKDHDERIAELRREQKAYESLARGIGQALTLEFLTNEGLLPNYAFPEAPVRLRSIIWRKRNTAGDGGDGPAFETRTFDYTRPPVAALGELAPAAQFFAGGRRVAIDQVDVDTAEIETWRFCDACSYQTRAEASDGATDCPRCGSPGWGEESQRRQLLRLQQVFARTSDRESRIRDDVEERQPRFFNRQMLITFRDEDRQGAWRLETPTVPFAFEYLRRARFREMNFGERSDDGTKFSIAGRLEARKGFVICKKCGKVQPKAKTPAHRQQKLGNGVRGEHTLSCPARVRGEKESDFEAAVYLYREFGSEAVRMLLPLADMGSERRLHSFVAGFQLGLKDRYGGRVDHLHTLVYSEPERDSQLRRQFLVLYDGVPGGTGYLKDLMQEPRAGEEHALIEVVRRARDRIRSCECFGDPTRDGCYRCLFAYRNSRDMSETSAHEANVMFTAILDEASTLRPTGSLSDVSVAGLMDSVLEARFVEALQRIGRPDLRVAVKKSLVRNKPGYSLTVGTQEWLVEPQVELGPIQGVPVPVSIDFVLRPASVASDRRPVAVFLDGFQFHRDRIGHDMLQRMTLLAGGSYDVWGLTWQDLDSAFRSEAPLPPMVVHPDGARLKQWYLEMGLGAHARVIDRSPLDLLLASLSASPDPVPWAQLGALALFTQMRASGVDVAGWREEVTAALPEPLRPRVLDAEDDWLFARRPAEDPHGIGIWAALSRAAAADRTRGRLTEVRAVVWLDDAPLRHDTSEYREAWRAYLFAFLMFRALPRVAFVTRSSTGKDGYEVLLQMQAAAHLEDLGWEVLEREIGSAFVPLIEPLYRAGVEPPEVGMDLPDSRGLSSGVEGELVWEGARVAIVGVVDETLRRKVAPDWRVFTLEELLADVAPVVAALRGTTAGENR